MRKEHAGGSGEELETWRRSMMQGREREGGLFGNDEVPGTEPKAHQRGGPSHQ